MSDSALSDRSRLYSVTELASEFSLTSQGIRFYEESGLIAPARVGRTRVFDYHVPGAAEPDTAVTAPWIFDRCHPRIFELVQDRRDRDGAVSTRTRAHTERIQELESKRHDLDETLAGLHALELEAKERLERALNDETKRRGGKNGK